MALIDTYDLVGTDASSDHGSRLATSASRARADPHSAEPHPAPAKAPKQAQ
jgi:hypothetical protein